MPPEATEETAAPTTTEPNTTTTEAPETTTETTAAASPTETAKSLLNEDTTPPGAPEKYEAFRVPEGFELDGEVSTSAQTLFKDLNLSQEAGQRLVDFYIKQSQEASEAPYKFYDNMRQEWRKQIQADKEIGGRLDHVKTTVSRAIDSLGDRELSKSFREAMDLTGAGDHPAFVKAFYKLAQRVTESSHVVGNGPATTGQRNPASGPRSAAQALYPDLPTG